MDRSPLAGEVVRCRDGGPRCVAAIKRQRGPRSSLGAGGSRAMRPRSPRRRSLHTAAHVARSTSVRTAQHSTPWAQHARPQPTGTARHGTPDHCAACSRARAARCTCTCTCTCVPHTRVSRGYITFVFISYILCKYILMVRSRRSQRLLRFPSAEFRGLRSLERARALESCQSSPGGH